MSADEARLNEEAVSWHVRLRDGGDADWEAFVAWLAVDPRHAAAYDAVEALDRSLDPIIGDLYMASAANDDVPLGQPSIRRRTFGVWPLSMGVALAAGVAGFLLYPLSAPSYREIATDAGERRLVSLGNDAQAILNGGTSLRVDTANPRSVELVAGQAFFRVRHDAGRPFEVTVGADILRDLGTEFDVNRSAAGLQVGVAEGEVEYRSGDVRVTVEDGQMLTRSRRDGAVRVTDVPRNAIGSWRDRRLVYAAAPLSFVAEDLTRTLGLSISVAPGLRDRPFSGNLALRGQGEVELRRLAPALDVVVDKTERGWIMKSAGRVED